MRLTFLNEYHSNGLKNREERPSLKIQDMADIKNRPYCVISFLRRENKCMPKKYIDDNFMVRPFSDYEPCGNVMVELQQDLISTRIDIVIRLIPNVQSSGQVSAINPEFGR